MGEGCYGQEPLQRYLQRPTHIAVQLPLQHWGMTLHTHFSQAQPLQPPPWCGWHMFPQEPQSFAQVWQFSPWPGWH